MTIMVLNVAMLVKMLLVLDSMKAAADLVAQNLVTAQTAVDSVATDLADSHRRADETVGPHGAAADAASQTAPQPLD